MVCIKIYFNVYTGVEAKYKKNSERIIKQREAAKKAKEEAEEKLTALSKKAEADIDWNFTAKDKKSAYKKLIEPAFKYDKTHASAPDLSAFEVSEFTPGVFRELMRRLFNLWLQPREVAALVKDFPVDEEAIKLNPRMFLLHFIRTGVETREKRKGQILMAQREARDSVEHERQRKKRIAEQKNVLELDPLFSPVDLRTGNEKLKVASAMYDKNSPSSVSMDAFTAAFLDPLTFRNIMKSTLNLTFTPKELSALLAEYNNGDGNVDCSKFMISFIKLGADERAKLKAIQLEKQRREDHHRKTEHERIMKEAEEKMVLKISYKFTSEERSRAFVKLAEAAKKYDRSHPGCMALDGFDCKEMSPAVFKELIRRTFNLVFTPGKK